jgi:hypothetical protein
MSSTITDDAVLSTLRDNRGRLLSELADQPDTDNAMQCDLPEFPAPAPGTSFQSHI